MFLAGLLPKLVPSLMMVLGVEAHGLGLICATVEPHSSHGRAKIQVPGTNEARTADAVALGDVRLCMVWHYRCTLGQGSCLISSVPVFMVFLNDVSPFRVKKKLLLRGNRRTLLKLFTHSSCQALRDVYGWTR